MNRPAIISIHSRKGGAGKTSIALSTAVQLAARGIRTAYVEADTMGTHIAVSFALSRDCTRGEDGALRFHAEEFGDDRGCLQPVYSKRKTIADLARGDAPVKMSDLCSFLQVSGKAEAKALELNITPEQLGNVREYLAILPMSVYLRDVDAVNQLVLSAGGQELFGSWLDKITLGLQDNGYRVIVLDHAPGLSFSPGVGLYWALRTADRRENPVDVSVWFVSSAAFWEQGLVVYETNPAKQYIKKAHPLFVINQASEDTWAGFFAGALFPLDLDVENPRLRELRKRLYCLPLWSGSGMDFVQFARSFADFSGYEIAVLRWDQEFAQSALPREQPSTETPGEYWLRAVDRFSMGRVLSAIAPQPRAFHAEVRSGLVEPLICRLHGA